MTYLQIVNAVLIRLRQPTVATIAENTYSAMVGELVNQAKRECEDAWSWLQQETTHGVTATVGVDSYTLTDFGKRAQVMRVHNLTTLGTVISITRETFDRYSDFTSVANNQPSYWRINGQSGDDPIIQFFPTPDTTYVIQVYARTPQDDLAAEGDVLTIPEYPVILGAYYLTVSERGDDRGNALPQAQKEYQQALSDAIAIDNSNRVEGLASDWVVV